MNTRIELNDTFLSSVIKLTEGNPGAMIAIMETSKEYKRIDPDSAFGELSILLNLDSCGIYGTNIYILYTDICDKDKVKFIAVLRAVQLGFFSKITLKDACSRQDYSGKDMIPVDDLLAEVKERLPLFGVNYE